VTQVLLGRLETLATEVCLESQDLKDLKVDWDLLVKVDSLDQLVSLVHQDHLDFAVSLQCGIGNLSFMKSDLVLSRYHLVCSDKY